MYVNYSTAIKPIDSAMATAWDLFDASSLLMTVLT